MASNRYMDMADTAQTVAPRLQYMINVTPTVYQTDSSLITPFPQLINMPLTPGMYMIHDTGSDWVLAYYSSNKRIGTWNNSKADYEKWYVKCYPGNSKYAIQDTGYKKYIAVAMNGNNPCGAEEDTSVLELEHQFQDFYLWQGRRNI
ncbi:hypothetical protein B0J17DRAFT_707366 [Rhizoctonia solani]|nr:hypothetical protein B0J17DRAFT_707366 [Rhizoctonia solani]